MGVIDNILAKQHEDGIKIREEKQRREEAARLAEEDANKPAPPPKKAGRPKGSKKRNPLENLTSKQQLYLQGVSKGMSKFDAALAAGYSHSSASSPSQKIETTDVKIAFRDLMRDIIKPQKIARRVKEGLDSKKPIYATQDGKITDLRLLPDMQERRKYSSLAAEMADYWNPKQETISTRQIDEATARMLLEVNVKLGITSLPPEQLAELRRSHVSLEVQAHQNTTNASLEQPRHDDVQPHQEHVLSREEALNLCNLPKPEAEE